MWFLNYENLRGFFENQTIVDDVISGRKWRWIKKIFGVIKDLELNFHMQQLDLHYLVFDGPRNYRTETMFSIFKWKKSTKTDSNWGSKSCSILSQVHRIRWACRFFPTEKFGRSSKLKLKATNTGQGRSKLSTIFDF